MSYVDGVVLAVPAAKEEVYIEHAKRLSALFKEFGATRVVDCWGDDVPAGKLTDFHRAVKAEEGEVVVFSWLEWPSKAVRDAAWPKVMEDPRMAAMGAPPFDGKRMIYGGFRTVQDS
ncbi:MAG: DUF1428 domain-containing protein [Deltaproteobacteria bacterium]|nr:DUF1428 domain-containing protein [Deltaproteobacteria bacterium]MCB9785103.1 DUF1428 domain-containing protein [Deltaproteobacteria bacterium]